MKWFVALCLMFCVSGVRAADSGKGKEVFGVKCASCHGKDAKGKEAMAKMFKLDMAALDLIDESSLAKTDKELFDLTAEGINKMPGYKDKMKPEDIDAVIAYMRSLAPALGAPVPSRSEGTMEAPVARDEAPVPAPADAAVEEEAKPEGGGQEPEGD